jgi:hypothetical protein
MAGASHFIAGKIGDKSGYVLHALLNKWIGVLVHKRRHFHPRWVT